MRQIYTDSSSRYRLCRARVRSGCTAQQLVAFTLILPLSHELLDRFLVKGLRRYWVS